MCYFPVFLYFVCFVELHGFHKENDLMTMTILPVCAQVKLLSQWLYEEMSTY